MMSLQTGQNYLERLSTVEAVALIADLRSESISSLNRTVGSPARRVSTDDVIAKML
jgi:hypothetical protein